MSGSHGNGVDATRLDRLVHTIDKFVGRLQNNKKTQNKSVEMRGKKIIFIICSKHKIDPIILVKWHIQHQHKLHTHQHLKLHIFTEHSVRNSKISAAQLFRHIELQCFEKFYHILVLNYQNR